MRYIALKTVDGTIVGVEAVDEPDFVRYSSRHDIFIGCTEKEAQGIVSPDGKSIYEIGNNEQLKSIRDDIVLNAFFIDKDEYDRLCFLFENSGSVDDYLNETEVSSVPEEGPSEVITMLQLAENLESLKKEVANIKTLSPLNDEATIKFYETLSSSSTNSIAKIRNAAQQYLDDTAAVSE